MDQHAIARDLESQERRSLVKVDEVDLSAQATPERKLDRPAGGRGIVPEPHPDVDVTPKPVRASRRRAKDNEQVHPGKGLGGAAKHLGDRHAWIVARLARVAFAALEVPVEVDGQAIRA